MAGARTLCTHKPSLLISSFFSSAANLPAEVTGKSADDCWPRRRGHAQSDVGGILDRNAGTGDCLQRWQQGLRALERIRSSPRKEGKSKKKKINQNVTPLLPAPPAKVVSQLVAPRTCKGLEHESIGRYFREPRKQEEGVENEMTTCKFFFSLISFEPSRLLYLVFPPETLK